MYGHENDTVKEDESPDFHRGAVVFHVDRYVQC